MIRGIGVSAIQIPLENDWDRSEPALIAYVTIGALQIIALIRYPGDFLWASLSGFYYLVFIASIFLCGVYCLYLSRKS